jgi:hypothetical protein
MVSGSPTHSDRPMTRALQKMMNAYVTSLRAEEGDVPPLPRRNPDAVRHQHHRHDGAVRRIEDVLAVKANDELAADGDHRGGDQQRDRFTAQQERKRESRNRRTTRIERDVFDPAANRLRRNRGPDEEHRAKQRHIEVEREDAVEQEDSQRADLVEPRIESFHAALDAWDVRKKTPRLRDSA